MKHFKIVFTSGLTVAGSAKEIVEYLRKNSYFESGLTNWQYRRNFARRHNRIHRYKMHALTNRIFVETLAGSPEIRLFIRSSK